MLLSLASVHVQHSELCLPNALSYIDGLVLHMKLEWLPLNGNAIEETHRWFVFRSEGGKLEDYCRRMKTTADFRHV